MEKAEEDGPGVDGVVGDGAGASAPSTLMASFTCKSARWLLTPTDVPLLPRARERDDVSSTGQRLLGGCRIDAVLELSLVHLEDIVVPGRVVEHCQIIEQTTSLRFFVRAPAALMDGIRLKDAL